MIAEIFFCRRGERTRGHKESLRRALELMVQLHLVCVRDEMKVCKPALMSLLVNCRAVILKRQRNGDGPTLVNETAA